MNVDMISRKHSPLNIENILLLTVIRLAIIEHFRHQNHCQSNF